MLDNLSNQGNFAYEVNGDEMADAQIHDGDILIFRPTEEVRSGDLVILHLHKDDKPLVRYIFYESWGIRLQPIDPGFPDMIIDSPEKINIGGKVILIIRKTEVHQTGFAPPTN